MKKMGNMYSKCLSHPYFVSVRLDKPHKSNAIDDWVASDINVLIVNTHCTSVRG